MEGNVPSQDVVERERAPTIGPSAAAVASKNDSKAADAPPEASPAAGGNGQKDVDSPATGGTVICITETGKPLPAGEEASLKFLTSLRRFILLKTDGMELGIGAYRIPRMGKEEVNLPQLYRSVVMCGGYHKTIQKKGSWKVVAFHMRVPSTVTNAAYMLRVHYEKFLLEYEYTFWDNPDIEMDLLRNTRFTREQVLLSPVPSGPPNLNPPKASHRASLASHSSSAPVMPRHIPSVSQNSTRMIAMQQVQEILSTISPSIGPYFYVPANFEAKNWNEIMKALTSMNPRGLAWSLNALAVIVYDARQEVNMPKLPGLLEALMNIMNACILEYPIGPNYRSAKSNNKVAGPSGPSQQQKKNSNGSGGVVNRQGPQGAAGPKQQQKRGGGPQDRSGAPEGQNGVTQRWWILDTYDLLALGDDNLAKSTQAVAACRIMRNLSFSRGNAEFMAANPYCVHILVRCLGEDLLYRYGTDGTLLRFAALDTLANLGTSMSLPKLGIVGKFVMQAIIQLLGGPIMIPPAGDRGEGDTSSEGESDSEKENEDEEPELSPRIKGAILACDLLSQLSLGTENAQVIQDESIKLGAVSWLTAHMKNERLQMAAVSALHRLVNLPGSTMQGVVAKQRFCVETLVRLGTTQEGLGSITTNTEAISILKVLAGHADGRAALMQHRSALMDASLFGGNSRPAAMLSKVLMILQAKSSGIKKQRLT